METIAYLKTFAFGTKLMGTHFQFKVRVNKELAKKLLPLVKKYPEVKVYITKAGKYIIGGAVHQSSPLRPAVEAVIKSVNSGTINR